MTASARLLSLATALPPHILSQEQVVRAAVDLFGGGRSDEFERMLPVFATVGVGQRHGARPFEWYLEPRGWPERTAAYLDAAQALFVEASERALAAAGIEAREIDTIVTASSTGISMPSLEARAARRLGLRDDVLRVPLFGLGCAGGVSGLSVAARLAEARPGSVTLFVAVELCTLAVRLDEVTKVNMVAGALFGDGAAACVVRAGSGGVAELGQGAQHTWPDTLDVMAWTVDAHGFGTVLDRTIPPFVDSNLRPALDGMLRRIGLPLESVNRFVCHPGGSKVVAAIERALGLAPGALDHERHVLGRCGNMSGPTVLFILERVLAAGLPDRSLLVAMGPGLTASCLPLTRAA